MRRSSKRKGVSPAITAMLIASLVISLVAVVYPIYVNRTEGEERRAELRSVLAFMESAGNSLNERRYTNVPMNFKYGVVRADDYGEVSASLKEGPEQPTILGSMEWGRVVYETSYEHFTAAIELKHATKITSSGDPYFVYGYSDEGKSYVVLRPRVLFEQSETNEKSSITLTFFKLVGKTLGSQRVGTASISFTDAVDEVISRVYSQDRTITIEVSADGLNWSQSYIVSKLKPLEICIKTLVIEASL